MSMSILVQENQIIVVIQHMSKIECSLLSLSTFESKDAIARAISVENRRAYSGVRSNSQKHKQKLVTAGSLKFRFDFSRPYQPISHIQCLRYIDTIRYNCLESPTWEKSQAKESLNFWHDCLIREIFSSVKHLEPTRSGSRDLQTYTEQWIKGLTRAVKASDEYVASKPYFFHDIEGKRYFFDD